MNVTLVTQTLSNESFNISAVNPESGNSHYSPVGKTLLVIVATFLSLVTVVGNIMVMISFKIDKQLQTISNYFLFSLAVADFAIGLFSMPLFTVYNVLGYWPLGPHICDTWLALDYLASNASVLNLLIISFDRYFSVTRPLTYRAKRTTYKAGIMIACAWGISLLLWPPWIYAWPYIEGQRTVQGNECYIQFLETNHYITFGTAIAAFYIPVSVMIFLYWRIWRETEKRQKDLPNLQAGNQDASKRSNSRPHSDEALDLDECRRPRSESSTGADELNTHFAVSYLDRHYPQHKMHRPFSWTWLKMWCVAWWHSGREDEDDEDDIGGPESSKAGCEETLTPISAETPITATESRCPSLSVIQATSLPLDKVTATAVELNSDYKTTTRTAGNDSVYTILIRLPTKEDGGRFGNEGPSIKMYHDEVMTFSVHNAVEGRHQDKGKVLNLETSLASPSSIIRRPSHIPDIRIPLNARNVPKTLTTGGGNKGIGSKPPVKKKKKTQEKKADKKAAKTLSAILLAFIITWTPYNILVLLKPLAACTDCIPQEMWDLCYYLCYINSTVNPVCYALCNANFRRTYVRILTCKWHSRNRTAMNRGY